MVQESLSATELVKPASVILQVIDSDRELDELEQTVQAFQSVCRQLTLPMDVRRMDDRSLQLSVRELDRLFLLVQEISDRLETDPVEMRLTFTLGPTRLQIQTKSAEQLLGILPTLDTLLPARLVFQAKAQQYALRRGELSPVERANLELLRYRLELSQDTADTLINRALGPYLDRQAKLQRYREVLSAELDRQTPLSDTTWAELRQLYQGLGLSYEDVAPIDQEYITRIQAEVTRLQLQEEATRLQQETQFQEESQQHEVAEQQNQTERYRQEFRAAIASTLYPSEFDRGRLEQARRLWELDPELVRAIEREITDERYGPIESHLGLDYSRLRQLLWLNQWEAADQETERLILTALSRDMRSLDGDQILQFDCVDVQTVDALWARYSRGKFGFKAQYQVYAQQEGRADEFLTALGWQEGVGIGNLNINVITRRTPYRELQFDLEAAPPGHLPTWRWAADTLEGGYVVPETVVDMFFLRLEKCMPALATEMPKGAAEGRQSES